MILIIYPYVDICANWESQYPESKCDPHNVSEITRPPDIPGIYKIHINPQSNQYWSQNVVKNFHKVKHTGITNFVSGKWRQHENENSCKLKKNCNFDIIAVLIYISLFCPECSKKKHDNKHDLVHEVYRRQCFYIKCYNSHLQFYYNVLKRYKLMSLGQICIFYYSYPCESVWSVSYVFDSNYSQKDEKLITLRITVQSKHVIFLNRWLMHCLPSAVNIYGNLRPTPLSRFWNKHT